MKPARLACAALTATLLLAGCSDDNNANEVPRSWIAKEYSRDGFDYRDPSDRPAEVAGEIDSHREAFGRLNTGGRYYLRYRDDIVAVFPLRDGSRIEIEDYRDGHRRWHGDVGHAWPSPGSSGNDFRGGGPGSGK
ncbi:DUF4247 domain-containing protein [Streptomyces sp. JJ38]|uniref:DUF4247 domain-containing protein n=1 Tax=Streptomyces sp. JJ38 TaxID=2738128 RepID=UPI001C59353D|nr:DUF4247 domain-containing protein [Streptomyces sp. JJ38]MBW1598073.1 DUF4247 domain-containing protein [Streptomyces sp. JJ38]